MKRLLSIIIVYTVHFFGRKYGIKKFLIVFIPIAILTVTVLSLTITPKKPPLNIEIMDLDEILDQTLNQNLYVSEENPQGLRFTLHDDGTYTVACGDAKNRRNIIIPETYMELPVVGIDNLGFYTCTGLRSIVIPNTVTHIGDMAFGGCLFLKSVVIGNGVTSIGDGAFLSCNLESVVIPDSVTSIGNGAFYDCYTLTSIVIGDSVTSIGDNAFYGCYKLTSITVNKNNRNYTSIDGNLYSKDGKVLIQYAIGKTDTSFTIPDSVTSIGKDAFSGCDALTSIVIPKSVTNIGEYEFEFNANLSDVYYTGSEEQWLQIVIGGNNNSLANATIHYNYVPEEN